MLRQLVNMTSISDKLVLHSFYFKNLVYKNIEVEICEFLRIF